MLMTGNDNEIIESLDNEEERKKRQIREREEELCDMFMIFDKDKDGYISGEELSSVMMKFGGLDKVELDIMIGEADADGDGMVLKLYSKAAINILYKYSTG